jgi:hypothetical protein
MAQKNEELEFIRESFLKNDEKNAILYQEN